MCLGQVIFKIKTLQGCVFWTRQKRPVRFGMAVTLCCLLKVFQLSYVALAPESESMYHLYVRFWPLVIIKVLIALFKNSKGPWLNFSRSHNYDTVFHSVLGNGKGLFWSCTWHLGVGVTVWLISRYHILAVACMCALILESLSTYLISGEGDQMQGWRWAKR